MSTTLLVVLVIAMFFGCCIVYLANKKIAANLYERTYRSAHDLDIKSPYTVFRCQNEKEYWGYGIKKNDVDYTNEWYSEISYAINVINTLEKLEGYKLSKV